MRMVSSWLSVCLLVVTMSLVVSVAPAYAASPQLTRTKETFLNARFETQEGCLLTRTDVSGAVSTTLIRTSRQSAESVSVSIFVFDTCTNQELLSASGYQDVPVGTITLDAKRAGGIRNTNVPVFVPKGPGYTVAVPINLTFRGTGKASTEARRLVEHTPEGPVVRVIHTMSINGTAKANVVLPASCAIGFCEQLNLAPQADPNAQGAIVDVRTQAK